MKKFLFALVILLLNLCAFAQTDPIRTEQNYIFQNINKRFIPTGYLNEYGPEVVEKKWLTGILNDSNIVAAIDVFNMLYNDLENSRFDTSTFPQARNFKNTNSNEDISAARIGPLPPMLSLDSVMPILDLARYDSVTNLTFISANYATLREDAVQQNLFTVSGNQIYDVPDRTQSPYIFMHTFAAVPVISESPFENQIKLGCQPYFYGNLNKTVAYVKIDFLDGNSYQTVYNNGTISPLTKLYTDSSGYKKFAVKVIYTDNTIDECYTQQYVNVVLNANTQNRYIQFSEQNLKNPTHNILPSYYLNTNPPVSIFSSNYLKDLQKFNQNMKIYIRYSSKRNGTNKIVKPFIVVEGYDITDASTLLKAKNYDVNTFLGEIDGIRFGILNKRFTEYLDDDGGYDLIFIDYYTMRSITENADYLLQAIDWINSIKENNSFGVREQNVVMGISMGGLVSRYALAKRTKQTNSNSTETRQLITMDSPHQGANVPLGLQHLLYDLGETKIVAKLKTRSADLKAFYDLNNQPSTQQQLLIRVIDGDGNRSVNTFLAPNGIYRNMVDYVAPYQFLAISNGSQCAKQVLNPGEVLINKSGEVASVNWGRGLYFSNKYRLTTQVNALPAFGNQSQICYVKMERNIRSFFGLIGTGWNTTSNSAPRISPANTFPWDAVPGGTRKGDDIAATGMVPGGKTFFGYLWRQVLMGWLINVNYNVTAPFINGTFTFVPITSSLDVQNITSNTFSQPFNYIANGISGSRADKFITQESTNGTFNEGHTNFTARNSRWIYNEMENITQPTDCQNYCLDDLKITPDAGICGNSNTYEIANLPPGASVI